MLSCVDPDVAPDPAAGLNPKVVEMYTKYVLVFSTFDVVVFIDIIKSRRCVFEI